MVAVRWYLRYGLSYRDVEELLAERGTTVDHVTVYRWVQRFARHPHHQGHHPRPHHGGAPPATSPLTSSGTSTGRWTSRRWLPVSTPL
jgi:transposase